MLKKCCDWLRGLPRRVSQSRACRAVAGAGVLEILGMIFREYKWLAVLALAALLSNVMGYCVAGVSLVKALYGALTLFFVNPVLEESNALIILGQYLSLIVAAGVLVNVVGYALKVATHLRVNREADSTAVYTDHPWGEQLAGTLRHGYLGDEKGQGRLENARYQIIMYGDDMKNLSFYAAHAESLRDRTVYIMLTAVDSFLLKEDKAYGAEGPAEGPRYFNPLDLMARLYWQKHSLYGLVNARNGAPVRVAVTAFGAVGQAILRYAVLNNVFRLNQRIEYHVWGCDAVQRQFLEELQLANGDAILVEPGEALTALDRLNTMDRVILAGDGELELLQQLLLSSTQAELHWYGRSVRAEAVFAGNGRLESFGDMDGVLTEDIIKSEALYRDAKLLNYDYVLRMRYDTLAKELEELGEGGDPKRRQELIRARDEAKMRLPGDFEEEMDDAWRMLSGFHKGSNIARADHLWIERQLERDGLAEECPELEHIRWCRYHYYNHWQHAPVRNNALRRHHLLVPFQELSDAEKSKDGIFNDAIRATLDPEEKPETTAAPKPAQPAALAAGAEEIEDAH